MPDFPMNTEDFVEVVLAATSEVTVHAGADDTRVSRALVRAWCALIVVDKPAADRAFDDIAPSLQPSLLRAVEDELDHGSRVMGIA